MCWFGFIDGFDCLNWSPSGRGCEFRWHGCSWFWWWGSIAWVLV